MIGSVAISSAAVFGCGSEKIQLAPFNTPICSFCRLTELWFERHWTWESGMSTPRAINAFSDRCALSKKEFILRLLVIPSARRPPLDS
jgi:hypothetical protein